MVSVLLLRIFNLSDWRSCTEQSFRCVVLNSGTSIVVDVYNGDTRVVCVCT